MDEQSMAGTGGSNRNSEGAIREGIRVEVTKMKDHLRAYMET